jgi:hypothetical protein
MLLGVSQKCSGWGNKLSGPRIITNSVYTQMQTVISEFDDFDFSVVNNYCQCIQFENHEYILTS